MAVVFYARSRPNMRPNRNKQTGFHNYCPLSAMVQTIREPSSQTERTLRIQYLGLKQVLLTLKKEGHTCQHGQSLEAVRNIDISR